MPRYDRDEVARRAGFGDWREAVAATAGLSQQEAARVLGVSHPTVRAWRAAAGEAVAVARPTAEQAREAFRADPADERHGSANGYRNLGCRCPACTAAWSRYRRERAAGGS
ncbi:helix-turn-helix domain-containing protein [Kineococcus terrestris]|uniref:helix-turn-helix domain-containing protein n=1 Tax=Kineococcus terrestris TaxID=2044856 RepID=UPI0034DAFC34